MLHSKQQIHKCRNYWFPNHLQLLTKSSRRLFLTIYYYYSSGIFKKNILSGNNTSTSQNTFNSITNSAKLQQEASLPGTFRLSGLHETDRGSMTQTPNRLSNLYHELRTVDDLLANYLVPSRNMMIAALIYFADFFLTFENVSPASKNSCWISKYCRPVDLSVSTDFFMEIVYDVNCFFFF